MRVTFLKLFNQFKTVRLDVIMISEEMRMLFGGTFRNVFTNISGRRDHSFGENNYLILVWRQLITITPPPCSLNGFRIWWKQSGPSYRCCTLSEQYFSYTGMKRTSLQTIEIDIQLSW